MGRPGWLLLLFVAAFLTVHVSPFIVEIPRTYKEGKIPGEEPVVMSGIKSTGGSEPSMSERNSNTTVAPETTPTGEPECVLPPGMAEEIKGYQGVVDRIIEYVTSGAFKGQVYKDLAELVDTFGARPTGTGQLEEAIDWMVQKSVAENLENVHTEDIKAPHWVRNKEEAWMTLPYVQKLEILGLSPSVPTPPEGIKAEVLVVKSFDDLTKQADKVPGKIVVFNPPWVNYGVTVQYRSRGASEAAKLGAVAALVRSITDFSIKSPHTGMQFYSVDKRIPVACVTVEDAAMMERMQDKGMKIEVQLLMEAKTYPDVTSRNTVAEVLGSELPNETVMVSGHIDSWDVGQGAMDDGGGMMISWAALVVLKKLGLRPRRTVRAVLFTAEEQGLYGGIGYYLKHKDEHEQFQLILESDKGTFTPLGLEFDGTTEAQCIMKEVLKLLHSLNATQLTSPVVGAPDIMEWRQKGVPVGGLENANERYFWFHHSHGDTLSVEDPDTLDRCLAVWASVAYVLADMKERLPRPAADLLTEKEIVYDAHFIKDEH